MQNIVSAILANKKRMDKMRAGGQRNAAYAQAKRYVIAECAAQKVKLTEEQILDAAFQVLKAV